MSCGCENNKKASDYLKAAELAKKYAVMQQCIVELRKCADGRYTFNRRGSEGHGEIVEFIHYL